MQKAQPTVKLLQLFSVLVFKSFEFNLESGYEDAVEEFSHVYMKMNQQEHRTYINTPRFTK